jgi:hypothetical protein
MGTSTSHRSPATAEWERVRELYQQPNPAPGEIVSQIVAALDEGTRVRLQGAAVVRCLDAALWGSAVLASDATALPPLMSPPSVPALDLAGRIQALARQQVAADRVASTMGSLALAALGATVVDSLEAPMAWPELASETVVSRYARYAREQDLSRLAQHFFAHDFDQVFRYFVTRDLSDFVGQPGLPTVHHARTVVDQVGEYCRERSAWSRLRQHEPQLQELVTRPQEQRLRELAPLLQQGTLAGLEGLAGG